MLFPFHRLSYDCLKLGRVYCDINSIHTYGIWNPSLDSKSSRIWFRINSKQECKNNESNAGEINKEKALPKEDSSPSQEGPSSEINISEAKFSITGKTISEAESSPFSGFFQKHNKTNRKSNRPRNPRYNRNNNREKHDRI